MEVFGWQEPRLKAYGAVRGELHEQLWIRCGLVTRYPGVSILTPEPRLFSVNSLWRAGVRVGARTSS